MADDEGQDKAHSVGADGKTDPTTLTTDQLRREIGALKDLMLREISQLEKLSATEIACAQELADQKFAAIDHATALRLTVIGDIPKTIAEKVNHLAALNEERFASVGRQFAERDTRTDAITVLNNKALDAALAAQKEAAAETNKSNTLAISKSETATTETINKLAELFQTTTDGLSDKIDDLKSRVGAIDATMVGFIERGAGVRQSVSDTRQSGVDSRAVLASVLGVLLFVLTVAGFVIALANKP